MTSRPAHRPGRPLGRFSAAAPPHARRSTDEWLVALGADARFVADVLGDLAEGYVARAATGGRFAASCWYGGEVVRSTPHIVGHTLANVARRGTPGQRVRLAGLIATLALVASALVAAVLTRDGPPARFAVNAGHGGGADVGVVVNHRTPVRIALQVLDSAGHQLDATGVRYAWMSGMRIPVSARGEVTCTRRGDAVVRAMLGALAMELAVHCEPLRKLLGDGAKYVLLGDTTQLLHVEGTALDGRPAERLASRVRVLDRSIATLAGARIMPRRAGRTVMVVEAGNERMTVPLMVVERTRSLAALAPDGHPLALLVRLAMGEVVRLPVAVGHLWIEYVAESSTASAVYFDTDGAPCWAEPMAVPGARARLECNARASGATVALVATEGAAAGLLVLRSAP